LHRINETALKKKKPAKTGFFCFFGSFEKFGKLFAIFATFFERKHI